MATKHICDKCNKNVILEEDFFKVQFYDGEHPHNGSTMYITKDLCLYCFKSLEIQVFRAYMEWDDFIK